MTLPFSQPDYTKKLWEDARALRDGARKTVAESKKIITRSHQVLAAIKGKKIWSRSKPLP